MHDAEVPKDLLEADCLINIPVAKHHGGATLSISMKNWMGSVKDRGFWHRNDLNECIVDFNSFLKPQLVVVDATRIMLDKGPQGPGPLAHPNEIIFSKDTVAADAYAATLFPDRKPEDIKYIRLGDERKVGSMKYRLEHIPSIGVKLHGAAPHDNKWEATVLEERSQQPGQLERPLKKIGRVVDVVKSSFQICIHEAAHSMVH